MERQQELCAEVNKRAPSLLESGEWTDCEFVVGAEPHQVVVRGYKLVMAMASPVFAAMFYGSLAETSDHIPVVDVEPEIFQAMLRYIYTGYINLSSCSQASQLYYTAKKYMLHNLVNLCSNYLCNSLNPGNVCQLYEHSQLYEDEVLTQKCINIFSENTKELLQDSSFTDAALSTVEKIFSLNELNIDSEVDLMNAAALYASAQDDKVVEKKSSSPEIYTAPLEEALMMNVENNIKDLIDTQNATDGPPEQAAPGSSNMMNDTVNQQQIRSVVNHIRLLTLNPQQYTDCTARSSLLTLAEELAVLVNLVSNKPNVPMPSGLSTSKDHRGGKARSEATFRYTMQNFSSLKQEWSPEFYVRNIPWQLETKPRDNGTLCLAVFVWCNKESKSTNWSCAANIEIKLICHKPGAENLVKKFQHLYIRKENNRGYHNFLPWSTVLDPTEGYIQDGAVTIEVHVAAEDPQGDL